MDELVPANIWPLSDPAIKSRRCKSWVTSVDVLTTSAVDAFEDLLNRTTHRYTHRYTHRTELYLRARDLQDTIHDLRDVWNNRGAYETQDTYDPIRPHLPRNHVKWKLIKRFIATDVSKGDLVASAIKVFDDLYDRANTPVRARELHNVLQDLRDRWNTQIREKNAATSDPFRHWVPPVGISSVSPPTQQDVLCFDETQLRKYSRLFNSVLHRKINREYGYDPDDKWSIMAFKKEGETKAAGRAILLMPLLRDIYEDPNKQMSKEGKVHFQTLLCRPHLTWEILVIWHTWVETGVLYLTRYPWQKERAMILVDIIGAKGGFKKAVKGHVVDEKAFGTEKDEERWRRGNGSLQVKT